MNIYLGTDHAGFELKERVKRFLITTLTDDGTPKYSVVDYGPYVLDPADDYPDYIQPVARAVQVDQDGRGIIFGGSGQGEAMAANRFKKVRAFVYYGGGIHVEDGTVHDIVALSREHNNANVMSIGARFVEPDKIFLAINQWLNTDFSDQERHVRRIEKLDRSV